MKFWLAFAGLLAMTVSARADIIFLTGPGNFAGDENLLFNEPGLPSTGTLVQGLTNQSSYIVDISSTSNLLANGGQARVEGNPNPYADLLIGLDEPNATFKTLIFNIDAVTAGDVTFTVTEDNGQINVFNSTIGAAGQNFFRFEAINDQKMKSVGYVTTGTVQDTRQIRIGGLATSTPPNVIPEPGSMALLAAAGLPLLGLRRRK